MPFALYRGRLVALADQPVLAGGGVVQEIERARPGCHRMIRYRQLFEVEIAHDYFLSRGASVLEAQPDADRSALTASFSLGRILEIVPDAATAATLAGHRMIFRLTDTGFLVAVQLDAVRAGYPSGDSAGRRFRADGSRCA